MNLYRTLLWWLLLALVGALAWEWMASDPGELIVRMRGQTITTSVAFALAVWIVLWVALWALWWLARLPLQAWRQHRQRQARNRLIAGLEALQQGRWRRAGDLLEKAAQDPQARSPALLGARRAAEARGDFEASARLQAELATHDAQAAALEQATRLLGQGRPEDALVTLRGLGEPTLPPSGLLLQIEAQLALGRGHQATPALDRLRREQALPPEALAALELRLAAASLREALGSDTLAQRWQATPRRLQELPAVAGAYAERTVAIGRENEGIEALATALTQHWDEDWVARFCRLPASSAGGRLASGEAWLAAHPESPALLTGLGRLCLQQQLWGKADDFLHRALAHGAGSEAWELLGQSFALQGDATRAQIAFANALRATRDEKPLALSGRPLREQIADQAVAEQRNEHGLPLLPR
ncbi:MAG TPA: heme biosynthesis HemY N-terminal domain-containing protein [Arenimonas sp.]|nr:heme biosynthesis HemY N-terminal domain-containing protein [Arenimonas sp.]